MSPIVLFVYNRAAETERLIKTLVQCPEAKESDLFVFSDGAKSVEGEGKVAEVRALFDGLKGFKSVSLIAQESNKGLSRSVIDGVSEILARYESAIILEDDLVLSPSFLTFMNDALETYRHRKDIWSISGYTPAIEIPANYPNDVFLVQRPQCWGWATWADRWALIDWEAIQAGVLKNLSLRKSFNLGGNDLYRTLDIWKHGRMDVWAIRWVFAAWLQHSWTLNPTRSLVQNGGLAEKATHGGWNDSRHEVEISQESVRLEPDIQPDARICQSFKKHHDLGLISKIGYFMRRYNLGYSFFKKLIG